jgi:hypothetical protein
MSINQEASKNIGNMCCRPRIRQRNPARKMKVGIVLFIIGLTWLGARMGLFDLSWLQVVPFWPAGFILLGVWMVYKGFTKNN